MVIEGVAKISVGLRMPALALYSEKYLQLLTPQAPRHPTAAEAPHAQAPREGRVRYLASGRRRLLVAEVIMRHPQIHFPTKGMRRMTSDIDEAIR